MRRVVLVLGCCTALLAPAASAHFGGFSLERRAGEYLVDIGYDTPTLSPGQPTIFSFALVKNPGTLDWAYEPYDAVEVSIEGQSVASRSERLEVTRPTIAFLLHDFPASEDYILSASYFSGATLLAKAEFLLPVQTQSAQLASALLAALPIAAFVLSTIVTVTLLVRSTMKE
jgi:hypothetical protein